MADYAFPQGRIAIFAKAPVAGQVKTRLRGALSPDESAELQAKLIKHSVNTALESQVAPVQLWCSPNAEHASFAVYADRLELRVQRGQQLGQRMQDAFAHNAQQAFTLLIGTDCPLLSAEYLQQAAKAMTSADVLLSPAHDGGYVLIASAQQPRCFDGIDWGTERVLSQSLSALCSAEQSHRLLPPLPDLDHPEDLAALPDDMTDRLGAAHFRDLARSYINTA